jgi:hypothetical protein
MEPRPEEVLPHLPVSGPSIHPHPSSPTVVPRKRRARLLDLGARRWCHLPDESTGFGGGGFGRGDRRLKLDGFGGGGQRPNLDGFGGGGRRRSLDGFGGGGRRRNLDGAAQCDRVELLRQQDDDEKLQHGVAEPVVVSPWSGRGARRRQRSGLPAGGDGATRLCTHRPSGSAGHSGGGGEP